MVYFYNANDPRHCHNYNGPETKDVGQHDQRFVRQVIMTTISNRLREVGEIGDNEEVYELYSLKNHSNRWKEKVGVLPVTDDVTKWR